MTEKNTSAHLHRSKCAICGLQTALCNSHIFPKFLARRHKNDVGNHIRLNKDEVISDLEEHKGRKCKYLHVGNAGYDMKSFGQDIPHTHLLCKDCEKRLSDIEFIAANHFQFNGSRHGKMVSCVLNQIGGSAVNFKQYEGISTAAVVRFWLSVYWRICSSQLWSHFVVAPSLRELILRVLTSDDASIVRFYPIALFEMPLSPYDEFHLLSWFISGNQTEKTTPEFVTFIYNRFAWSIALRAQTSMPWLFAENTIRADGRVKVNYSDDVLPIEYNFIVSETWYAISSFNDLKIMSDNLAARVICR